MSKFCSMCTYCTTSEKELVDHVCKIHRYHPNFQVYCASCLRSYSNWNSFKKHLSRGCSLQVHRDHSEGSVDTSPTSHDFDPSSPGDPEELLCSNSLATPSQQWHEAAYLLYIKEKHVITQAAIDTILPHTNQLFSSLLGSVSRELKTKLPKEAG